MSGPRAEQPGDTPMVMQRRVGLPAAPRVHTQGRRPSSSGTLSGSSQAEARSDRALRGKHAIARPMDKPGLALSDIDRFPRAAAKRLRSRLSVTTADEFLDLWSRFPSSIRSVLNVSDPEADRLARLVKTARDDVTEGARGRPDDLGPAASSPERPGRAYPYRTGLDPPPEGQDVFTDTQWERRRGGKKGNDA
jgi:hypothetical protein